MDRFYPQFIKVRARVYRLNQEWSASSTKAACRHQLEVGTQKGDYIEDEIDQWKLSDLI